MYLLMYVYVCIEGVNSGFEIGGGGGGCGMISMVILWGSGGMPL